MVDCRGGCPGLSSSPANYCCCRPLCECTVDNVAFPCLALGCTKMLISCCLGPCWLGCDAMCGIDSRSDDRPSRTANAVIVFTSRKVKDVEAYKSAFGKYAEETQAKNAGVRAMFSFMEKDKESTAGLRRVSF